MPEKGSVFTFSAVFGRVRKQSGDIPQDSCSARLSGKKVLVFDQNRSSGAAIVRMLQWGGADARHSETETELHAVLHQKQVPEVDFILIDRNMPLPDGGGLLRAAEIVRTCGIIPVIMLSAFGDKLTHTQLEQEGKNRLLFKPATPGALLDCLCAEGNEDAPASEQGTKEGSEPSLLSHSPKGLRVLLVEDNEVNAHVAQRTLELLGCGVTHASTGPEAVDYVRKAPFDIVFMDIQLPGMNGYETARTIRSVRRLKHLPIVALTAHAFASEREKSLAAGMNGHLCKPLDPMGLQRILKQLCSNCVVPLPEELKEPGSDAEQLEQPVALPGIDMQDVQRRMLGDWSLLHESMQAFKREFADFSRELAETLQANDRKKAAELAHTLKGASANISAQTLREITMELEQQLKSPGDTGEIIQRLTRELDLVLASLEKLEKYNKGQGASRE